MKDESYNAIVQRIVLQGKHGPYAVASHERLGDITFSLIPPVWEETDLPEHGIVVVLSTVRRKRAGWRAYLGRFFQPSDLQLTQKKEE